MQRSLLVLSLVFSLTIVGSVVVAAQKVNINELRPASSIAALNQNVFSNHHSEKGVEALSKDAQSSKWIQRFVKASSRDQKKGASFCSPPCRLFSVSYFVIHTNRVHYSICVRYSTFVLCHTRRDARRAESGVSAPPLSTSSTSSSNSLFSSSQHDQASIDTEIELQYGGLRRQTAVRLDVAFNSSHTNASVADVICSRLTSATTILSFTSSFDAPVVRPLLLPKCVREQGTALNNIEFYCIFLLEDGFASLPSSIAQVYFWRAVVLQPSSNATLSTRDGLDASGKMKWDEIWSNFPQLVSLAFSGVRNLATLPDTLPSRLTSFRWTTSGLMTGTIPATLFSEYASSTANTSIHFEVLNSAITGTIPPNLFAGFASKHRRIFRFVLPGAALSGTLPAGLFSPLAHSSSQIFDVNLSNNRLTGTIPPTWFPPGFINASHPTNSFKLLLHSNRLTGSLTSSLMSTIPNIASFTMDLSSNQLSGPLPSPLLSAGFPRSFIVNFNDNLFSGNLPSNILPASSSPSIYNFELLVANNRLEGSIPALLLRHNNPGLVLSTTFNLDLSNNSMSGTIPTPLFTNNAFDNLFYFSLNLRMNRFSGPILEHLFAEMESDRWDTLEILLDQNQFQGAIPAICWHDVPVIFSASSNRLNGTIPSSWGSCRWREINIASNLDLAGPIPPTLFNLSTSPVRFTASHTSLTGDIPPIGNSMVMIDLSYVTTLDYCSASSNNSMFEVAGDCILHCTSASNCSWSDYCDTSCPPPPVAPSTCPSSPPSPAFMCINGVWTAPSVVSSPTLVVPSGTGMVVINSNLTSSSVVFNGLNSSITIYGCAPNLTAIVVEMTQSEAEKLQKSAKELRRLLIFPSAGNATTACANLSNVGVSVRVKEGGCRKVSASKEVIESGKTLAALFTVDSSGCNRWWIILVSVIAAIVLLAVVAGIIAIVMLQKKRDASYASVASKQS